MNNLSTIALGLTLALVITVVYFEQVSAAETRNIIGDSKKSMSIITIDNPEDWYFDVNQFAWRYEGVVYLSFKDMIKSVCKDIIAEKFGMDRDSFTFDSLLGGE